eukprot:10858439-Heterocapsa_arctica.AAC.1
MLVTCCFSPVCISGRAVLSVVRVRCPCEEGPRPPPAMEHDEEDVLLAALAPGPGEGRLKANVGRRVDIPGFDGRSIGDDVSWRGSSVL